METLKLKIFDVLTEKIAVSEFENWLYNSEEFMNQMDSNSFCFYVISINYKDEKWQKQLDQLAKEKYDEDFKILYQIELSCIEILKSVKPEETNKVLSKLLREYDYETEYSILIKFYVIHEYFDTFYGSMFNKFELMKEAKFYANQAIELAKNCNDFKETKMALSSELIPFKNPDLNQNQTFKNKFLAFFKKI